MIDKKSLAKLTDSAKQLTPVAGEAKPSDAFIRLSVSASRAASRYRLGEMRLDDEEVHKAG